MNCVFKISPSLKIVELRQDPIMINITSIDEETAAEFREAMSMAHNSGQDVIPIVIDSYGGNIHSLISMIDTIKNSHKKVATIITGKALGCAAILAAMGSPGYRFISKNSSIMLNNLTKEVATKNDNFKPDIREVERLYNLICEILDDNCQQKLGYFKDLIKDKGGCDWYLEAADTIDFKLMDHIGSPWFEVNIRPEYEFDGIAYKENIHEID
jgi:ATP-dependent Clp protease protease subunit